MTTSANKASLRQIVSVLLPIAVLAGWMGFHAFSVNSGRTVHLPVAGVDPRDLLAGHYLTYRVDYGIQVDCSSRDAAWCLCLDGRRGTDAYATSQGSCPQMTDCNDRLRGSCSEGTFSAGIDRYYFAETFQKELAVVPPKASIAVALSASGRATIKDLLVDGVPVLEWLTRNAP